MAETLSPIGQKQRLPMASRIQSPRSPFFLGSNDDRLERTQARAARSAAIRRKSIAANLQSQCANANFDPGLNRQQILELFHNCTKLASENKINQKNTWELNLIDHLTDIINAEEDDDVETNFQKASCTLEAGVKIYALRVDSVHSGAYKVLDGMNRAGQESEQATSMKDVNVEIGHEGGKMKLYKKISPLSTLESSFEVLNVKKFDAAFAVDPLYHQTTAQFDEGGAKGLLMNNLGVYGGCRVLFDSLEVPGKCMTRGDQHDVSDTIDLSFARECVEQLVLDIRRGDEISPTLRTIVNRFDEKNRRPSNFQASFQKTAEDSNAAYHCEIGIDGEECLNSTAGSDNHDDQTDFDDLGSNYADSSFPSYLQDSSRHLLNNITRSLKLNDGI